MPSSPEKRRGNLTLAGDIEDAGGTEELLDLSLKLYKALPPRSRAPLSAPPPARTPEERGPADRRREKRVALEIALFYCRRGKTVRVATPSAHYVKVNKDVPLNGRGLPYYMKLFMDVHAC